VGLSLEAVLPIGGRPRQLSARALLVGMLLAAADGRPAHLVRVHGALIGLDEAQRRRLGVEVDWRGGPHLLTYRQVERTAGLVSAALAKPAPDGEPSEALVSLIDTLVEASIPTEHKNTTTAEAVDWTDYETWSRPGDDDRPAADAEASWGHRKPNAPGARHETFLGYYFQAATMVAEDSGPAVPELIRRVLVAAWK